MDTNQSFRAMWVEEFTPGKFRRAVVSRKIADLPGGDVLVQVKYSSLNYKDALSASGNRGVTRVYPHTPGIDAAGVVVESRSPKFKPGDEVFSVSMGDLGVNTPGGFGEYIRVPAEWLMPLPPGLTLKETMAYGTAGFTAGLCVERLAFEGVISGNILVTGATGGVGNVAVALLRQTGYHVTAATGKPLEKEQLVRLGADEVIDRQEVNDSSGKPLLHSRWDGVVDTVGGNYLSTAIRATRQGGVVTACGNAASAELPITVFPFILRGVTLAGIDATRPTYAQREALWNKLAGEWKIDLLDQMTREISLDDLDGAITRTLEGGRTGRYVIRMGGATN